MIPVGGFRQLAFVALFLAASIPAIAQTEITVPLIGEIKVARGSFPAHRVQVTLETRGMPGGVMYADDEGKFLFRGIVPNKYYVDTNDPDFEPVRERVEIRELSGTSAYIQVILVPKDSAKQRPVKDDTSGGGPFMVDKSEYEKHYPRDAVREFDKANKAARKSSTLEAI